MGMNVGSNQDDDVMLDVNMTPLIDVMLVLLIMFIITIPLPNNSINIDLPNGTPPVTDEKPPELVELRLDAQGKIFWNESYIPDKTVLLSRLQAEAQKRPQPEVHIRGDQITPYEAIDQVISTTQQAGIGKIAFVTTPPATP